MIVGRNGQTSERRFPNGVQPLGGLRERELQHLRAKLNALSFTMGARRWSGPSLWINPRAS